MEGFTAAIIDRRNSWAEGVMGRSCGVGRRQGGLRIGKTSGVKNRGQSWRLPPEPLENDAHSRCKKMRER